MDSIERLIFNKALTYLDKAEKLFGPKLEGVKFENVFIYDKPQIKYSENNLSIAITLSPRCREDDTQLALELAHEVCHLLHPTINPITGVKDSATVLNEGLSTYFSILMASEYCNADVLIELLEQNSPNYFGAFLLINELIKIDNDIIQKLRKLNPKIDRINKNDFRALNLNIPESLVEYAISIFDYSS